MPSLFLALIASGLALAGGKSARLVAQLSAALGGSFGLLLICWLTAIVASGLAAWGGGLIEPTLNANGKRMFVAMALAMAALELAWPQRKRKPAEPTRSLGAAALVLLAGQVTDAARFLVLALSVASGVPALAAIGGAIGTGAVLTLAWSLGSAWETRLPLGAIRLAIAALFVIAAMWSAMSARGMVA
ncbi:TMEM165/GDT1 family protein [Tsuneonella sp. HG222]